MKASAIFVYGIACYARVFRHVSLRRRVHRQLLGAQVDGLAARQCRSARALLIDLGLLALFAVQHSVMARPAFKRWWTRIVPESAERSTYVLFSSLALILLFWLWQPMGGVVWNVTSPSARDRPLRRCTPSAGCCCCTSTFLINHFDLFGLRQVWLQLHRQAVHAVHVRHALAVSPGASSAVHRLVHRSSGRRRP